MKRHQFITTLTGITLLSQKAKAKVNTVQLHFLRHATLILNIEDVRFLIDPMLNAKDSMDPVANCKNVARIPMVELPITMDELSKEIASIDAVVVTHTHRDHWDPKAQELIPGTTTVICQPPDADKIRGQGFTNVIPINESEIFKHIKIARTGGQHGTGEIGVKMGKVSGFVFEYKKQKIYIAGDTIWCEDVEKAIETHRPDFIVVNAGAAQFDQGDPITMTADDVVKTIEKSGSSKVIAVHMDTVNHCGLKRTDLKEALEKKGVAGRWIIPSDGERLNLG